MIRIAEKSLYLFALIGALFIALFGFYLGASSVETVVSEEEEVLVFEFQTPLWE